MMQKRLIGVALTACLITIGAHSVLAERSAAAGGQEQDEVVLEAKGYLVPIEQVRVSTRVAGEIIEIYFKEGSRVEKGAVLARIDPTPYELDFRRAEALLAAARARLEEVQGPAVEKKGARNPRLEVLRAEVAAAEAAAAKAKWRLDATAIRAPISGTVLTKLAEKGNVLDLRSFNLRSSLCDVADLTRMEVDVAVQERDLRKVFKGLKCKIKLEAFPETTYKGEVSRIMPVADRARGAVPVRVRIDVPKDDAKVRPEMGALVSFLGKSA